jgi:glycosyltransferase involved in cell wall biosynthesis
MKRTKILHVLGELGWGGVPMRTLELLRYLDTEKYDLCLCAVAGVVGNFGSKIEAAGGRIVVMPYDLFRFSRRFVRLLREERFDAVHSHMFYQSGNILRLASKCEVPIRVAQFRSSRERPRNSWRRRLEAALLRHWIRVHATDILAVSEEAMSKAWSEDWHDDPRCRVVYNGLDPRPYEQPADRSGVLDEFSLPADAFLCIHVGRMVAAKNHLRLIDIFAAVTQQRDDAYLLLIGIGEQEIEDAVRRRVAELGIGDRVRFGGLRKDVPRLLMAADVMVYPSLWEGLPGVVLEACAAGVPVVASNLLTIQEIALRLPGIEVVSLGDPDESWASRIARPLGVQKSPRTIGGPVARVRESVFGIEHHAEAMCSIWDGQQFAMPAGG